MKSSKLEYAKAYGEALYILKQLEPEEFNKIPNKLIKLLETKKDRKWQFEILPQKSLIEQNLLEETKAILAVIYRLYLSDFPKDNYNI